MSYIKKCFLLCSVFLLTFTVSGCGKRSSLETPSQISQEKSQWTEQNNLEKK